MGLDLKNFNFLDFLKNINLIKFRGVNLKLFGNLRTGLYKEVAYKDISSFITEFREFLDRNKGEKPDSNDTDRPVFQGKSDFQILERLCNQYYIYEGTDRLQRKIAREVDEIIREMRDDVKAQKELEAWLDATHDGIMSKFRTTHPEMKESDIKLFSYLQAGFSPTIISVLLGKEKSVVYNRTSRLKAKLSKE